MDFGMALINPLDSQLSFTSGATRNIQENERDPSIKSPNSTSRSLDLRDPYLPEDDGSILTPEHAFIQYQTRSEDQTCQICGQPAVGFHHRAYVCEACKKFFMRHTAARSRNRDEAGGIAAESVCPMGGQCRVEGPGRGKCPHCRYRKCLDLGMTLTPPGGEGGCDISQIPCRVCGGPSSGFHFGALTCEGCKGFFRRTVLSNNQLECLSNNDCPITPVNRNMCKSCRYQRCLAVGMSKTGSRIGRQPNAIKYYCAREISQLSTSATTGSNSDSESPAACAGTATAPVSRNSSGNRGGTPAPTPTNGAGGGGSRSMSRQWTTSSSGTSSEPDDVGGHRSPSCCSLSSTPAQQHLQQPGNSYAHLPPQSMHSPAMPMSEHHLQQQYNGRSSGGSTTTPVDARRASSSGFSPLPPTSSTLPPPLVGSPFDHNGTLAMKASSKKRRSLSDRLPPSGMSASLAPPPPPAYFDTNGQQHGVVPLHLAGEVQQPLGDRLKYASTSSTCSSASSSPSCPRGDYVLGRHPTPPGGHHHQQHHHRPWYTGTNTSVPPVSHASDGPSLVMLTSHVAGARDTSDYATTSNNNNTNNNNSSRRSSGGGSLPGTGVTTNTATSVGLATPGQPAVYQQQFTQPTAAAVATPAAVAPVATSYVIDEYAEVEEEEEDRSAVVRRTSGDHQRRQLHFHQHGTAGDDKSHHFFYASNPGQYRTGGAAVDRPIGLSSSKSPHSMQSLVPSDTNTEAAEAGRDREPARSRSARSVVDNLTSTVLQFHNQQQQQQYHPHHHLPQQFRLTSPNAASLCQLEQIPSDSEVDCSTLSVIDDFPEPSGASGYYRSVPRHSRPGDSLSTGGDAGGGKSKYDNRINSPGPLSPPPPAAAAAPQHQQHAYASGVSYASPPSSSGPYGLPSHQQQQVDFEDHHHHLHVVSGPTKSPRPQRDNSRPVVQQQQQSTGATTRLPYSASAYSSSRIDPVMPPSSQWHLGGPSNYNGARHHRSSAVHQHQSGGGSFRLPPDPVSKFEPPVSPTNCLGSRNSPMQSDRSSPSLSLVGPSSAAAAAAELCTGHDDASAPFFAAAAAAAAVAMVASQAPSSSNSPAEAVAAVMDAASVYTMASGLVRSCEAAAMGGMAAAAVNPRTLSTTTCFAKRLKLSVCDDPNALASASDVTGSQHKLMSSSGGGGKGGSSLSPASSPISPATASSSTSSTTMAAMQVAMATAAATAAGLVLFNRRNLVSEEHRQHHRVSVASSGGGGGTASGDRGLARPPVGLCISPYDAMHVTVTEFADGIKKAASCIVSERNKPLSTSSKSCPPMHALEHVEEVWGRMMQNFEVHSRFVVHFAKLLPGFSIIHLDDKRQLVRAAMYPLMLLKLSQDYVNKTNSKYNYFDFSEEEREVILKHFPTFHTITSHLIRSGEFLDRIRLDNIELALAGAQEVFKNRDGLRFPAPVDHLYNLAVRVLEDHIVASGHVVQERLNAFKRLSPLLEEFNIEHHRILAQLKHDMPQLNFPELYTEMFHLTEDEEREQRISVMQSAAVEAAAAAVAETIQ